MILLHFKKVVTALQGYDYITSYAPVTYGGETIGYTITFAKNGTITIYNGSDGKDGKDGENGISPVISVKKDTDDLYYWTLNGEWLTDADGAKIKTVGTDGVDGNNGNPGRDGITPQLKIQDNFWYLSSDNGTTSTQAGKATGDNGVEGDDIFKSVAIENGYIVLTMNDEANTILKIKTTNKDLSYVYLDKKITLTDSFSLEQLENIEKLEVNDGVDMYSVLMFMSRLRELSFKTKTYKVILNTYRNKLPNRSLRSVTVISDYAGDSTSSPLDMWLDTYACVGLQKITTNTNVRIITNLDVYGEENLYPSLLIDSITILDGPSKIEYIGSHKYLDLSSTVKNIGPGTIGTKMFICRAVVPPILTYTKDKNTIICDEFSKDVSSMTVYVPRNSIDVYKASSAWGKFGAIKAIEDME